MAFPTTPTNGQQYTVNGTTYQWNNANGTWDKVGTTSGTFGAIFNGNSNVTVSANSNVSVYIAGNATARAVFTSTGANIDGTANISGNANVGNLGTAGLIVATGDISGANLTASGDISGANLTASGTLSVTGNSNVGNIGASTAVLTTAANVPLVQNGNSNISIDADSHVRISANGTANIVFVAANGNVGVGTASPVTKLDISGSVSQNVVAVAASAVDCSTGNYFTKTASGALTWTFTNVPSSRAFGFILELTNGGTGTQSWPASVKWPSGIAPTLTASGVDVLGFITDDGGTTWRGVGSMIDSK